MEWVWKKVKINAQMAWGNFLNQLEDWKKY